MGEVTVTLRPAGHVLGSAQVVLEKGAERIVVSGDYKRRRDPTCARFEVVTCDLFITEATFAPARLPPSRTTGRDRAPAGDPPHLSRARRSGRRLQPGQGAAHHRPAEGSGLRPADLYPRRARPGSTRPMPASASIWASCTRLSARPRPRWRARSSSRRPRPCRIAGRAACPIRSPASPRAGCGYAPVHARAASSCRSSSPTTPTGTSSTARWTMSGPPCLGHPRRRGGADPRRPPEGHRRPGAAPAGLRGRRRMRAFADLLDALSFQHGRNGKLALLRRYLATTPDPDRGWALAALTGDLSLRHAKPGLIRGLVMERVDETLFALSYDYRRRPGRDRRADLARAAGREPHPERWPN